MIIIDGSLMRKLGTMIQKEIPGVGFALVVFEFKAPGIANYISNADREDMIKGLQETVDRLRRNKDFPTPETG